MIIIIAIVFVIVIMIIVIVIVIFIVIICFVSNANENGLSQLSGVNVNPSLKVTLLFCNNIVIVFLSNVKLLKVDWRQFLG